MTRSIKSYLYTSVRNACINHIRDNKKFRSSVLDVEIYGNDLSTAFEDGLEQLETEELAEKIQDALKQLPAKSLEVFKMSRMENMKYKEIAEHLGVTVKTVEAHMSKALRILREELKDYLILWILFSLWMG